MRCHPFVQINKEKGKCKNAITLCEEYLDSLRQLGTCVDVQHRPKECRCLNILLTNTPAWKHHIAEFMVSFNEKKKTEQLEYVVTILSTLQSNGRTKPWRGIIFPIPSIGLPAEKNKNRKGKNKTASKCSNARTDKDDTTSRKRKASKQAQRRSKRIATSK